MTSQPELECEKLGQVSTLDHNYKKINKSSELSIPPTRDNDKGNLRDVITILKPSDKI